MEYQIVHVNSESLFKTAETLKNRGLEELSERVTSLRGEGWKPQGGVCVSARSGGFLLTQAMVK